MLIWNPSAGQIPDGRPAEVVRNPIVLPQGGDGLEELAGVSPQLAIWGTDKSSVSP